MHNSVKSIGLRIQFTPWSCSNNRSAMTVSFSAWTIFWMTWNEWCTDTSLAGASNAGRYSGISAISSKEVWR